MWHSLRFTLRSYARPAVLLLLLLALLVSGVACPKKAEAPMPAAGAMAPPPAPAAMEAKSTDRLRAKPASAPMPPPAPGSSSTPVENKLNPDQVRASQMIIWKGVYQIKVDQAADAADKLRALAEANGGWVSALAKQTDEAGNTKVSMTVRVPSANFSKVVSGAEGLGKVQSGDITSDNVTEEWVDLGARLRIKEQRKAQLEALLKQAKSVDEIDKRQQDILAVQEEIERIQGRQHVLQDQVALSTLDVVLFEKGLAPPEKPGPFSVRGTALRAWYALLAILRVLLVIALYVALPGAIVWIPLLLWYLHRRKHPRRSSMPPAPPPPVE